MPSRKPNDSTWPAGLFFGADPGGGSGMQPASRPAGQVSADAMEQFKQMVSEAVATGISEGTRRVEARYSRLGFVVVAALVITAAATATLAVIALLRDGR